MSEPQSLRQQIRAARRLLSETVRADSARAVAAVLAPTPYFRDARRIAAYLATDGEMDPSPLVTAAWDLDKEVYLPIVGVGRRMAFARYRPESELHRNRLGILEPQANSDDYCAPQDLHLVLTPMVAFDERGTRMGMGGGFYDRCFEFILQQPSRQRPQMVGLAYALQCVAHLDRQSWDVPLDAIATEDRVYQVPGGGLLPGRSDQAAEPR